eukprot:GHVL01003058.1.p1 GENE.GHVL01003058.1~~GHVL01003058.1.p1  ORF type:complete len:117 (+),score=27.31 GHVL01003058.1:131-481(+)
MGISIIREFNMSRMCSGSAPPSSPNNDKKLDGFGNPNFIKNNEKSIWQNAVSAASLWMGDTAAKIEKACTFIKSNNQVPSVSEGVPWTSSNHESEPWTNHRSMGGRVHGNTRRPSL